jgi:hypothetical protein
VLREELTEPGVQLLALGKRENELDISLWLVYGVEPQWDAGLSAGRVMRGLGSPTRRRMHSVE